MQLPKELTTVTPVSKTVALIMFIALPIIAFLFGMRYQTMLVEQNNQPLSIISPTLICATPSPISPTKTQGDLFCGGIAGKLCPSGYNCRYEGTYPDAGGTCIKEKKTTKFTCPTSEYVDCMPGPGKVKVECSSEFLQWAQANCPNFKGVAY